MIDMFCFMYIVQQIYVYSKYKYMYLVWYMSLLWYSYLYMYDTCMYLPVVQHVAPDLSSDIGVYSCQIWGVNNSLSVNMKTYHICACTLSRCFINEFLTRKWLEDGNCIVLINVCFLHPFPSCCYRRWRRTRKWFLCLGGGGLIHHKKPCTWPNHNAQPLKCFYYSSRNLQSVNRTPSATEFIVGKELSIYSVNSLTAACKTNLCDW